MITPTLLAPETRLGEQVEVVIVVAQVAHSITVDNSGASIATATGTGASTAAASIHVASLGLQQHSALSHHRCSTLYSHYGILLGVWHWNTQGISKVLHTVMVGTTRSRSVVVCTETLCNYIVTALSFVHHCCEP